MTPLHLTTGLELELLLPVGKSRIDLLAYLASWSGWTLQPFDFASKLPVPRPVAAMNGAEHRDPVGSILAQMQDVADHHQARLQCISDDGRYFFLAHPAGHLLDDKGAIRLSVVHDNTIAGGLRVAELITAPMAQDSDLDLARLIETVGQFLGITVPARSALHVHVDGAAFCAPAPLLRLVQLYNRFAPLLRRWLRSPDNLLQARPLPPVVESTLRNFEQRSWAATQHALRPLIADRGYGLNLYNLLHPHPDKLTVEVKIAGGSLDPAWIVAARRLVLNLAHLALQINQALPTSQDAFAAAVAPDLLLLQTGMTASDC